MTRRTLHMMTVDLPVGLGDLGAELEVDICFTWQAETQSMHFVAAEPAEPFSGPYADRSYDLLQDKALDWFDSPVGHERALKQIKVDEEDGL